MKKGFVISGNIVLIIVLVVGILGAVAISNFAGEKIYFSPVDCDLADVFDLSSTDYDKDGYPAICNSDGSGGDNCPTIKNNQGDSDGDSVGNACDNCNGIDSDKDGRCDNVDPHPYVALGSDYQAVASASPSPSPSPTYSSPSPSPTSTYSPSYSSPSPSPRKY